MSAVATLLLVLLVLVAPDARAGECPVPLRGLEMVGAVTTTRAAVSIVPFATSQWRLRWSTTRATVEAGGGTEVQPSICESGTDGDECAAPVGYDVTDDQLAVFKASGLTEGLLHYYALDCRLSASYSWEPRPLASFWTLTTNTATTTEIGVWADQQQAILPGDNRSSSNWDPLTVFQHAMMVRSASNLAARIAGGPNAHAGFFDLGDTAMLDKGGAGWFGGNGPNNCIMLEGEEIYSTDIVDGAQCRPLVSTGSASAGTNQRRVELVWRATLNVFNPVTRLTFASLLHGNHDNEFGDVGALEEVWAHLGGGYRIGVSQAAMRGRLDAMFNPNEDTNYYGSVGNRHGWFYAYWSGKAAFIAIDPYKCSCTTEPSGFDLDEDNVADQRCGYASEGASNLPNQSWEWQFCDVDKAEVESFISGLPAGVIYLNWFMHNTPCGGSNSVTWGHNYARTALTALDRGCINSSGEAAGLIGHASFGNKVKYQARWDTNTSIDPPPVDAWGEDCRKMYGPVVATKRENPPYARNTGHIYVEPMILTRGFSSPDCDWIQAQSESFISTRSGNAASFVWTGHDHIESWGCKLNSSGVCSKVIYGVLARPTQFNISFAGLDEMYDSDGDGIGEFDNFFTAIGRTEIPAYALQGAPHLGTAIAGYTRGIFAADALIEHVSSYDSERPPFPVGSLYTNSLPQRDVSNGDVVMAFRFDPTRTPVSVSLACACPGGTCEASETITCTATPANASGRVLFQWDDDGDWNFRPGDNYFNEQTTPDLYPGLPSPTNRGWWGWTGGRVLRVPAGRLPVGTHTVRVMAKDIDGDHMPLTAVGDTTVTVNP